ncbi:hypothetical protein A3860_01970 [Niastella vici]|uniref:Uncharacterized protein n=1 Tax=Niastella vici TaxID=1703345 RepID=A0A1V9G9B4_9BACT|nr:hypothetical protein [Niastella vici]OQP67150.1 hypothetical protein A3860_01970 [Niastella vici]
MQQPNAFTSLRIVHIALLSGMTAFAIVAMTLVNTGFAAVVDDSTQRILQVVCILLSVLALFAGFKFFKKRILAARNHMEAGEKRMEMYRTACILWWAMIEGPGIVAGVAFVLSGNYAFFALAVFHILALLTFAPRKANIILFLNLSKEEVVRLEGGKYTKK